MFVITISGCTTIIQVRLTADLVNTVNRIRIMKLSIKKFSYNSKRHCHFVNRLRIKGIFFNPLTEVVIVERRFQNYENEIPK